MRLVNNIENTLVKYAAGEASEAEETLIRQWLAEAPANMKLLAGIETLLNEAAHLPMPPPPDEQAAWQMVQGRIMRQPPKQHTLAWLRVAAAIIVIAASWALFVWHKPKQVSAPAVAMVTISAEYGLQTDTLPDGSVVTLTGPSSITYPAAFAGSARQITLTGHALFRVAHQQLKPFVIKVKDITVTDIGTSFYIGSSPVSTSVVVYTGAVEVSRGNKAVKLLQGESIQVQPGDSLLVKDAAPKMAVQESQGFPQAADFEGLPENVAKQKQIMRAILRDIRADGLSDSVASFALDANGLSVNNIAQPATVFNRYKAKYLHLQGLGFYYGNTTSYGTGFIFSQKELNQ